MMTDPVADMLTRIRNALRIGRAEVDVPSSRAKVGMKSIVVHSSAQVAPAGTCPGQRMTQGTRIPPSQVP